MILTLDDRGRLYDANNHVVGKVYCPGIRPIDIEEIKRASDKCLYIDDALPKTSDQLAAHVVYLQGLQQPEQRSPEWYQMRENRLTARDLAAAIGESNYDSPFDVLVKKCGGGPPFTGNVATQWGVKYEPVATSIYENRNAVNVIEFGLLPHPTIPFLGASPDGITKSGTMLEIKCPLRRQITGIVPYHYWVQMQLQLEVCDLEVCHFEECKFVEYKTLEEYQADASSSDSKTADGFEKGILLEWYDRVEAKPVYRYCPLGMSWSDARSWISETMTRFSAEDVSDRYIFKTVTFWRLTVYSCVPVPRDRVWWNGVIPRVTDFWMKVCYYRTHPIETLYQDYGKDQPCVDLEDDTHAPEPPPVDTSKDPFLTSDDENDDATTEKLPLIKMKSEPVRHKIRFLSDSDDD